ncbi:hypothetical protein LCGC14_2501090 [marine sediment metagenome]|uniref:Uncharacterized protein n=1 Tax=marine sediment metagenome TaxID=412755 RepID=A0A0F9DVL6_9ZZZZ
MTDNRPRIWLDWTPKGWLALSDFTNGWAPTSWTELAEAEQVKRNLEALNPGYRVVVAGVETVAVVEVR